MKKSSLTKAERKQNSEGEDSMQMPGSGLYKFGTLDVRFHKETGAAKEERKYKKRAESPRTQRPFAQPLNRKPRRCFLRKCGSWLEMGRETNTRVQPKLLEQEARKAHVEEMRLKRNKFFQESMKRDGLTAKQLAKK